MERYEHGGDIYSNPDIRLDFSINTNPLGMPDAVRQALIARVDEYSRYPDPQCSELRAAIARHENVPEDWVLCGNGAADLIYRLCYAVKPRKALVCAPTFTEYERALEQVGCQVTYHALLEGNHFALTAELAERLSPDIDILFLCHPNNPTGRLIPKELLGYILEKARQNHMIVVVDECFLDFSDGESSKRYADQMLGLIVLKAFTKIYTMAGLRLGYLLTSDKSLVDKVSAAAQCWSVSVPAQIAGVAALKCTDWLEKTRCLVAGERRFLSGGLYELEVKVFPSDANFLLLRCEQPLHEALLQKGILIRSCENFRELDATYYRVAVKTRSDNLCLIQAVKEFLNG